MLSYGPLINTLNLGNLEDENLVAYTTVAVADYDQLPTDMQWSEKKWVRMRDQPIIYAKSLVFKSTRQQSRARCLFTSISGCILSW